jgi:tRNA 2-thiouridine synthesizing protein A
VSDPDGIKAHLDARGLECPEPVLKTREVLKTLHRGERVEVLADDPIAPIDFAAFSHRSGHPLRESSKQDGVFRFVVEHK